MAGKNYTIKCSKCGGTTSRQYARKNHGHCKPCVTGVARPERDTSSSYSDRQGRLIDFGYEQCARYEGHYD